MARFAGRTSRIGQHSQFDHAPSGIIGVRFEAMIELEDHSGGKPRRGTSAARQHAHDPFPAWLTRLRLGHQSQLTSARNWQHPGQTGLIERKR